MRYVFVILAGLLPSHAEAQSPIPDGEYVFVDEILTASLEAGKIGAIYIHVTSKAETLSIAFMTAARPHPVYCKPYRNCERPVEALTLEVEQENGPLKILSHRVVLTNTIWEEKVDREHIVDPTRLFFDGATVSSHDASTIPGAVRLTKSDGRTAFLVPASRRFVEDAVDTMVLQQNAPLYRLDKCLIRQIARMAARRIRNAEDDKFLKVVTHAGWMGRLRQKIDAIDGESEKGSQAWRDKIIYKILVSANAPLKKGEIKTPREAAASVHEKAVGSDYASLAEEAFTGRESNIFETRAWLTSIDSLLYEGWDPAIFFCEDITLSKFRK